jgi:hypothetical protein
VEWLGRDGWIAMDPTVAITPVFGGESLTLEI